LVHYQTGKCSCVRVVATTNLQITPRPLFLVWFIIKPVNAAACA
jgi:hypothetical protein